MADIPGLIEGASDGAGLGTKFLGHVERTAVLIHLIDGTAENPAEAWRTIRGELDAYGAGLESKFELVVLNKADALDPETRKARIKELKKATGQAPHVISGVSGEGVTELLRAAWRQVEIQRREEAVAAADPDAPHEAWRPT